MLEQSQAARLQVEIPNEGLHVLSNFSSPLRNELAVHRHFRAMIDELIPQLDLTKVGEAYHDFAGGGFTGVVCLAESHVSIHTWPERGYATFDVYLSNHTRDNSSRGEELYERVLHFFSATVIFEHRLHR